MNLYREHPISGRELSPMNRDDSAIAPTRWGRARLKMCSRDQGFTLVELMVVVLVIAILLAIAIPTFLGARERSEDRSAQSNLRNALTAAKVTFSNTGNYSGAFAADLTAIEPNLTYLTASASSTAEDIISVFMDSACNKLNSIDAGSQASCTTAGTGTNAACTVNTVVFARDACTTAGAWTTDKNERWAGAVWSKSETCWLIRDDSDSTVAATSGTQYGQHTSPLDCHGTNANANATAADW